MPRTTQTASETPNETQPITGAAGRRFQIGERVQYAPSRRNPPKTATMQFTIVRVMPEGAPRSFYRIKGDGEACERIAAESQLEPAQ